MTYKGLLSVGYGSNDNATLGSQSNGHSSNTAVSY